MTTDDSFRSGTRGEKTRSFGFFFSHSFFLYFFLFYLINIMQSSQNSHAEQVFRQLSMPTNNNTYILFVCLYFTLNCNMHVLSINNR